MSDFKEHLLTGIELSNPRLNQIYRYDPHFKREDGGMGKSIPANADEHKAGWAVGIVMDKAEATEFWNVAKAHFKDRMPKEKFAAIHSYRDLDDGRIRFTAKRNAKSNKGAYAKEPTMIDHNMEPLTDRAIWGGSKGNIKVTMLPTENPSKKEWGISLFIAVVQVTEAIYGGGGDDLDGFTRTAPANNPMAVSDEPDNPYGLPDLPEQSAPSKEPAIADDLDDEIPF